MSNKKLNKKTSFLKVVATFAVALVSLLGLSACTWFSGNASTGDSNLDANGNLRVATVGVSLTSATANGTVDENTGSFVWDLNYYFDAARQGKEKSLITRREYDQDYYNFAYNNFFASSITSISDDTSKTYALLSHLFDNKSKLTGKTVAETNLSTTAYKLDKSGNVEKDKDGKPTATYENVNMFVSYPSYTVSVSGISYEIKVDVKYENLVYDFNENQLFVLKSGATIEDTFTFSYRIGGSGEWISCSENYNMASAFEKNGKFYVRFNPMLDKGSTSRYLRVQTNPSKQAGYEAMSRGSSVYTSPINFNAYKLTFAVSCNNSTQTTYKGLSYDSKKYYFSTKVESTSTGIDKNYKYKTLTGYFVDGKVVEVSRCIDLNSDYGLQAWTTNGKADNTVTFAEDNALPNNNGGYGNTSSDADDCLTDYSRNIMGIKAVKLATADTNYLATETFKDTENNKEYSTFTEILTKTNDSTTTGKIYVVACNNTASNTMYANIARVRNFTLSGTVYDGEGFFSSGSDAILADVDLYIWRKTSGGDYAAAPFAKVEVSGGSVTVSGFNGEYNYNVFIKALFGLTDEVPDVSADNTTQIAYASDQKTEFAASCKYVNSQFEISNLLWDCYISFGKNITDGGDETSYTFYSASMEEIVEDSGFNVLSMKKASQIYSDRAGNAIIGTKLDAESKIEVNIFTTTDNGATITQLGTTQTSANGVQYQVISTTKERTDAYGYTTSSVIISLLLPSDCSLIGYNLESINSVCQVIYTADKKSIDETESNYILCDIGYDSSSTSAIYKYYYVTKQSLDSTAVSYGETLNCLMYKTDGTNENFYQFSHRDKDGTNYKYYYVYEENTDDRYIIERSVDSSDTATYTLYEYQHITNLDQSFDISQENTELKVNFTKVYDGTTYYYVEQTEGADVDVVATGYKIKLPYKAKTEIDGQESTNTSDVDMYVYYNIEDYTYTSGGDKVTEYYYTAPIGIKSVILTNGLQDAETKITWFHEELNYLGQDTSTSELSKLVYKSSRTTTDSNKCAKVMIGADILSIFSGSSQPTGNYNPAVTNFYQATDYGKAIIADHYYYIAPLGEPTKILVSQYIGTDATTVTRTDNVLMYYTKYNESLHKGKGYDRYNYTSDAYVSAEEGEYVLVPYAGKVYNEVDEYSYKLISFVNGKDVVIDIDENDNYSYKTTYIDAYGNKVENGKVVTSMNTTDYGLYKSNGEFVEITYNGESPDILTQEYNKTIVANAALPQYEETLPKIYLKERISQEVFLNGISARLTTEYVFYTYSEELGSLQTTKLYYNGTNFYVATGEEVSIDNQLYPELKKLTVEPNVKVYDSSNNNLVYLTWNSTDSKWQIANHFTGSDGNTYHNICLYQYYTNGSNNARPTSLGEQYYNGIGYLEQSNFTIVYRTTNISLVRTNKSMAHWGFVTKTDETNVTLYVKNGSDYVPVTDSNGTDLQKYVFDGTTYVDYTSQDNTTIYVKNGYIYELVTASTDDSLLRYVKNGSNYEPVTTSTDASLPRYVRFDKYIAITDASGTNLQRYVRKELISEEKTVTYQGSSNKVVRRAQIESTGNDVHLLGKVVLLGNAEFSVYPSYNYFMPNSSNNILTVEDGEVGYYSVDYTTITGVIQAFPGVKILSGAPYANPILYFEVRHKADEQAVVNIGLELINGYYVEILSNAITSEQKNLIYDFATISFKDTITNLTSNDYIDRLYYVVEKTTQNTIMTYIKVGGAYEEYLGNSPLTIQNIGLNENDPYVYSILKKNDSGLFTDILYYKDKDGEFKELRHENLMIWESSSSAIHDVPIFDVHNYFVRDDGLVVLTSDSNKNELCTKIEDLFISGTGSTTSEYDYSNVLIGGTASAYRVNVNAIRDSQLQAFWWEDAVNITNTYGSTDPYFLTGKEGVVLVASPIVQFNEDGENIIYRFKNWVVYSRYNSEILYRNLAVEQILSNDIENAVLRFSSNETGYFVFMPIYERVYTLNLGSCIEDGALNLGGSINVLYNGTSIDMRDETTYYGDDARKIYAVEMLKTGEDDETQFQYSDLEITPLLYYTGGTTSKTKIKSDGTTETIVGPEFKVVYDVLQIKYTQNVNYTYYYRIIDGCLTQVPIATIEEDSSYYKLQTTPCILPIESGNGNFVFNFKWDDKYYACNMQYDKTLDWSNERIENLISHSYSVNYYMDGLTNIGDYKGKNKAVLYYKKATQQTNNNGDPVFDNGNPVYNSDGFANGDNYMYAIDIAYLFENRDKTDLSINNLINNGQPFAISVVKTFNSLATESGSTFANIDHSTLPDSFAENGTFFYRSNLAYLASGELYSYTQTDANGNIIKDSDGNPIEYINSTQQFKSSYFERDSKIIISASADAGYRLKDWYLAEYDNTTNSWVKSETTLTDSIADTYHDEIKQVYFNEDMGSNGTWYWKTAYKKDYQITIGENTTTYYVYYYDAAYTQEATVPFNMLDDVRGYYIESQKFGQKVYTPLYRKDTTSPWYTDPTCSTIYTGSTTGITQMAHYDAITAWHDGSSTRWLIGDAQIWEDNGRFYRTKEIGNIQVKNNKVYITNIHSNIRIIAEFIEVYQSYVLAEDSSPETLEVISLYYNTTGTRTDKSNNNLTALYDELVDGIDTEDFAYQKISVQNGTGTASNIYNSGNSTYTKTEKDAEGNDVTVNIPNYIGWKNFETLTSPDSKLYKAKEDFAGTNAKVAFKNMRFDVGTTIYIVVKMHYTQELTLHTLGMNSSYELTPVMEPTTEYLHANLNANNTNDDVDSLYDEHYFYIFKVTFDRDLSSYYTYNQTTDDESTTINGIYISSNHNKGDDDTVGPDVTALETAVESKTLTTTVNSGNYNPEYVVHVKRKNSIVADVLNGNYSLYYSQLFNFYDNDTQIELDFNSNERVRLSNNIADAISSVLGLNKDTNVTWKSVMYETYYENLKDLFTILRDDYGYVMNFDYVTDKTGVFESTQKLKTVNDIFKVVSNKVNGPTTGTGFKSDKVALENIKTIYTAPKASGSINYINLSTVPIYTYTTQIKVLSSVNTNTGSNAENATFDEEMEDVLKNIGISLSQKLYTRGGYFGYTYIGPAKKYGTQNITINGITTTYTQTWESDDAEIDIFDQEYALAKDTIMVLEGIEYNPTTTTETNSDGSEAIPEVIWETQNDTTYVKLKTGTRDVVINQQTTTIGVYATYVFTGWYEQKKVVGTNGSEQWSNLQFMSKDINKPFASVAYADTNIIALFERAVDVEISIPKNSATINFNTLTDSLGNAIVVDNSETSITTYKGTFTVSTKLSLDITPTGGYRISNGWAINIAGTNNISNLDISTSSLVKHTQDNSEKNYTDLNLVKTVNTSFVVGNFLHQLESNYDTAVLSTDSELTTSQKNNLLKITLETKAVQLTYIVIEGYTVNQEGSTQLAGYEIVLFDYSTGGAIPVVHTHFDESTCTVSNIIKTTNTNYKYKDSAQREIKLDYDKENNLLAIYGYFDFEQYNGNLYISYMQAKEKSIQAWYVNTHGETTDHMESPKFKTTVVTYDRDVYGQTGTETLQTFKICYQYTTSNIDIDIPTKPAGDERTDEAYEAAYKESMANTLNTTLFNLSSNNYAYMLKAVIEAESTLNVAYATVESLDDLDDAFTLSSSNTISVTNKGSLSWIGAKLDKNGDWVANGTEKFKAKDDSTIWSEYILTGNTHVTLVNETMFYTDGTNYYKFLGWFDYSSAATSVTFVSNDVTFDQKGGGFYIAMFAKVIKITDAYTTTLNLEDSKNLNGTIDIVSDYKLSVTKTIDGELQTSDVEINVFGYDKELFVSGGMYAMIGGNIKITVTTDNGYLINDIYSTTDPNDASKRITLIPTGSTIIDSQEGYVEWTVGTEDVYIVGELSRGYSITIIQIYYDTIQMNNVGIKRDDINLTTVTIGGETTNQPAFRANTTLTLTFAEYTNDFGLIGFYVDGELQTLNEITSSDQRSINYTVTKDATIEVRFTKYVKVNTSLKIGAALTQHQTGFSHLFEYTHLHSGNNLTVTNPEQNKAEVKLTNTTTRPTYIKEDFDNWILSGTTINLQTSTSQNVHNVAFVNWTKSDGISGLDNNTTNQVVSSNAIFSTTAEYVEYVKDETGNIVVTYDNSSLDFVFNFVAHYNASKEVTINKQLTSYNKLDEGYLTTPIEYKDGSYTVENTQFWANIDVLVTYEDVLGQEHTIMLGSAKNITIDILDGSDITIEPRISKSVESRYAANIWQDEFDLHLNKYNDKPFGSYADNKNSTTFNIKFYAKRNVTLVRQVNDQNSQDDLKVIFGYGSSISGGIAEPKSLTKNEYTKTYTDIIYSNNNESDNTSSLTAFAEAESGYTFAGFFINGISVGKGEFSSSEGGYAFYIKYGTSEQTTKDLYTTDTDLTIVALWYTSVEVKIEIHVDNVNILSNEDNAATAAQVNLMNKLTVKTFGNHITQVDKSIYNTNLQSLKAYDADTNINPANGNYLANQNIALIASQYAGYQFVGFYYKVKKLNETDYGAEIKLDFNRVDEYNYNFGDTLSSILPAGDKGNEYIIYAKYVTAWQVSQLVSVANKASQQPYSNFEDEKTCTTKFVQLYFDGTNYVNIADTSQYPIETTAYPLFAGTTTNNFYNQYFFPAYTNYIGVYFDSGYENGEVTHLGYYINGIYVDSSMLVRTYEVGEGDNKKVYQVIDLSNLKGILWTNINDVYDHSNIVIESKYVRNVDYVVRIGIDNTGDINKIDQSKLKDVKITVKYTNPYTGDVNETIYSNDRKDGTKPTYWNTDNNSLYISLNLPIGTKVETSITTGNLTGAIDGAGDSKTYYYNGWFVYSDYSVAASTSVINYTNLVEFVLTDDTDIIAQYYTSQIAKTYDTQYSYKFNGQEFIGKTAGGADFDYSLYSPTIQGEETSFSLIAKALTNALVGKKCNETNYNFTGNAKIEGLDGGNYITISSENGIIFNILVSRGGTVFDERKFVFMGWYQEIKDDKNPSTFLYVTNKLGLDYTDTNIIKPTQMTKASNMIAIFTQIVEIELELSENVNETSNARNSLMYSNLQQNFWQLAPAYFEGDNAYQWENPYLKTVLSENGTLTWHTLYNSNLRFNYNTAYGYHYNNCSVSQNVAELEQGSYTNLQAGAKENAKQSAIKYILGDDNLTIEITKYRYNVKHENYKLTSLETSTPYCAVHKASQISTTSAICASGATVASLACASIASLSLTSTTNPMGIDDDDINLIGNPTTAKFAAQISVPTGYDATGITFVIDVRLPDGTTYTLTIDGNTTTLFDTLQYQLPIGTTLYLQTVINNGSRVLDSVNLYSSENIDLLTKGFDLSTADITTLATTETQTYVITSAKYLRFVVEYKAIYNLELVDNNNDQGQVTIEYDSGNTGDSASTYNVNILTYDNFAFDDLTFKFIDNSSATQTDVDVKLKELLKNALNCSTDKLTDMVSELSTFNEITYNTYWTFAYDDAIKELTIIYKRNGVELLNVELTFKHIDVSDGVGYQYITGITNTTFAINTDVEITPAYMHVATVETFYTIEKFKATEASVNSESCEDSYTLYIFDDWFYTGTSDYIYREKLNTLYNTQFSNESLEFIGYYYAGEVLSNFDSTTHMVLTQAQVSAGQKANNIEFIEAVFVEQLSTNIGVEIDYYNDEIGYYDDENTNPNLLYTPLGTLVLKNNGTEIEDTNFNGGATKTILTNLNATSDITLADSEDYFSFVEWLVKYDVNPDPNITKYKYVANITGDPTSFPDYYKIESAALSIDTNFYQDLIEMYKMSKNYTGLDDKYAKYTEEETIDLSKFVIVAKLQEEVVELTINYTRAQGEQFDVVVKPNANAADSNSIYTYSSPVSDGVLDLNEQDTNSNIKYNLEYKVGKYINMPIDGESTSYPCNFLIKHQEIFEDEACLQFNKGQLIVAYSKYWTTNENLQIDIRATTYLNRNSAAVAKPIDESWAIRQTTPTNINKEYSTSEFWKLDGFRDSLGTVHIAEHDELNNTLRLKTSEAVHTTEYLLQASKLHLVEVGMATTLEAEEGDQIKITINSKTITLTKDHDVTTTADYAALSYLFAEGDVVEISIENAGKAEFKEDPTEQDHSYRGMAISMGNTLYTVSDLYSKFVDETANGRIYQANKRIWQVILSDLYNKYDSYDKETYPDFDDFINAIRNSKDVFTDEYIQTLFDETNYYDTLKHYSDDFLANSATEYKFVATQSVSIVADYIGLFFAQKDFINVLLSADEAIKYEPNTPGYENNSYKGDNFAIVIAPKDTEIIFKETTGSDVIYTEENNSVIIKTSTGATVKDPAGNTAQYHYTDSTTSEKTINFISSNCQTAFGIVSVKYVKASIESAFKYTTYTQTLLAALSAQIADPTDYADYFKYNWKNPSYTDDSQTSNPIEPNVYILDLTKDGATTLDSYIDKNEADATNYPLTSEIEVAKGSKTVLLAAKIDGYSFVGFKINSPSWALNVYNDNVQGINPTNSLYTMQSKKCVSGTTVEINGKDYYYANIVNLYGNLQVVALYEPIVYLINIKYKAFDSNEYLNSDNAKNNNPFRPELYDEETSFGRITAESLVISAGDIVELKISTQGFSEYKGMASGDPNHDKYEATYSINKLDNPTHHPDSTLITSDVSGTIGHEKLFVDTYSTITEDNDLVKNEAQYSYLYLFVDDNLSKDVTLHAYFTPLSYDVNVTFKEINSGAKDGDQEFLGTSPYIAYSDAYQQFVKEQEGKWKNPSANAEYGIKESDPYVYTWYDNQGIELAYPVKITTDMLSDAGLTWQEEMKYLTLKSNDGNVHYVYTNPEEIDENLVPLAIKANGDVAEKSADIYKTDGPGVVEGAIASTLDSYYATSQIDNLYNYIQYEEDEEENRPYNKLKAGLFSILVGDVLIDSGDLNISVNNYQRTNNNQVRISNIRIHDLATLTITLQFDSNSTEPTIKLKINISADGNSGFPYFGIRFPSSEARDNANNFSLSMSGVCITSDNYSSLTEGESANEGFDYLFFDDAYIYDDQEYLVDKTTGDNIPNPTYKQWKLNPEYSKDKLKLDVDLLFQKYSKRAEASVSFTNNNLNPGNSINYFDEDVENRTQIDLTKDYDGKELEDLQYINQRYHNQIQSPPSCHKCEQKANCIMGGESGTECSMIDAYYLYVLHNAQMYIDALEDAADRGRLSKVLALDIINSFITFNPAAGLNLTPTTSYKNEDDVSAEKTARMAQYDSLVKYGDALEYIPVNRNSLACILYQCGYAELSARLADPNSTDLMFTQLDVYANFNNKINNRYFGNNILYGDIVVSVCMLSAHVAPHATDRAIMDATTNETPAYVYLNNATSDTWGFNINDTFTTEYNNNFLDYSNMTKEPEANKYSLSAWWSGITNHSSKYVGTYEYVIHSGLVINEDAFKSSSPEVAQSRIYICLNNSEIINTAEDEEYIGGRLMVARLDKVHADFVLAAVEIVVGVAVIATIVFTGGFGSGFVAAIANIATIVSASLIVRDGIVTMCEGFEAGVAFSPMYEWLNNLDFKFN